MLGVRTRSNSSVTVTVNGQSRTFKDGEGVTFPRNQGAKQTVSGEAAFAGYGVTFAPLQARRLRQRNVSGKVAIFLGRTGPKGFTTAHNRILDARGRAGHRHTARRRHRSRRSAQPPRLRRRPCRPRSAWTSRPRSGSTRDSLRRSPRATSSSPSCSAPRATDYATLKAATEKQEPLPDVALSGVSITINVDATYDVIQTRLTRNVVGTHRRQRFGAEGQLRPARRALRPHRLRAVRLRPAPQRDRQLHRPDAPGDAAGRHHQQRRRR